jgi:LL-diaminopimelate aminotransferase
MIEEIGVVVTPGTGYGQYGEGFIRLSITTPDERVDQAVQRIREWDPIRS